MRSREVVVRRGEIGAVSGLGYTAMMKTLRPVAEAHRSAWLHVWNADASTLIWMLTTVLRTKHPDLVLVGPHVLQQSFQKNAAWFLGEFRRLAEAHDFAGLFVEATYPRFWEREMAFLRGFEEDGLLSQVVILECAQPLRLILAT